MFVLTGQAVWEGGAVLPAQESGCCSRVGHQALQAVQSHPSISRGDILLGSAAPTWGPFGLHVHHASFNKTVCQSLLLLV
jgi:hypothetical protein